MPLQNEVKNLRFRGNVALTFEISHFVRNDKTAK